MWIFTEPDGQHTTSICRTSCRTPTRLARCVRQPVVVEVCSPLLCGKTSWAIQSKRQARWILEGSSGFPFLLTLAKGESAKKNVFLNRSCVLLHNSMPILSSNSIILTFHLPGNWTCGSANTSSKCKIGAQPTISPSNFSSHHNFSCWEVISFNVGVTTCMLVDGLQKSVVRCKIIRINSL